MAYQTFALTGVDDDSATVVIAAGEIGRVRFTAFPADATVKLGITANGVTSYAPISSPYEHGDVEVNNRALFMDCGMPGDTLFVRVTSSETVTGVIEGIAVP